MSDTRKNEEQTREELLKDCELSLGDLEKVSGGKQTDFLKPSMHISVVDEEDFYFQTGG